MVPSRLEHGPFSCEVMWFYLILGTAFPSAAAAADIVIGQIPSSDFYLIG